MKRSMLTAGLLGPAMVVLALVTAVPLGRAVYLSAFNEPYPNESARRFVGLANYRNVLGNTGWWEAVLSSMAIVALVVAAQLVLGLGIAGVLYRLGRVAPITRFLVLVPFAVMSVLTAFSFTTAVDGGFLAAWFRLGDFGAGSAVAATCLAEVWRGTGVVAIILWGGLVRMPPGLLESAVADGATLRQRLTRVVLPAVAPAAAIAAVYRVLDSWRMFDIPYIARPGLPHPEPLQLWVFNTTVDRFEFGLGATMSVLFVLLSAVLGAVLVRLLRVRRAV